MTQEPDLCWSFRGRKGSPVILMTVQAPTVMMQPFWFVWLLIISSSIFSFLKFFGQSEWERRQLSGWQCKLRPWWCSIFLFFFFNFSLFIFDFSFFFSLIFWSIRGRKGDSYPGDSASSHRDDAAFFSNAPPGCALSSSIEKAFHSTSQSHQSNKPAHPIFFKVP